MDGIRKMTKTYSQIKENLMEELLKLRTAQTNTKHSTERGNNSNRFFPSFLDTEQCSQSCSGSSIGFIAFQINGVRKW